MVKPHFYQQLSIEESRDAMSDYEDRHYEEFQGLLFNELLCHIKNTPFDNVIENHLKHVDCVYETREANSLSWLYRADRKSIESITIYSFRFANTCHPEFYQAFETKAHPHFRRISQPRHGCDGWYEYVGQTLLNDIGKYLNMKKLFKVKCLTGQNYTSIKKENELIFSFVWIESKSE